MAKEEMKIWKDRLGRTLKVGDHVIHPGALGKSHIAEITGFEKTWGQDRIIGIDRVTGKRSIFTSVDVLVEAEDKGV